MTPLQEIARAMHEAERVALCSHIDPDGDTVGSALALAKGLRGLSKQVELFCDHPVPGDLRFLPGVEDYRPPEAAEGRFDLLVYVDAGDLTRVGRCASLAAQSTRVAQIDHHATNTCYAEINCVDATASATALIVHALLKHLGVRLDEELAACLYTGLATDTNNFSHPSTTAEAFHVAGELMDAGLPLSELNRRLFRQKPIEELRLKERALRSLTLHHGGDISSMALTWRDFQDCGALPEHAVTLTNEVLYVAGVRMAVFARETERPGEIRASLRAVEPLRVDDIAKALGGGGHAQAAGATMRGTLEACVARCVAMLVEALEREA